MTPTHFGNPVIRRILFALAIGILSVVATIECALAGPVPTNKPANYPEWWFTRDVIKQTGTGNRYPQDYGIRGDYAVANLGQAKRVAVAAMREMDAVLPGGAGIRIHDIVDPWLNVNTPLQGDYTPINLGQLKYLAKPFYDRLAATGYPIQAPPPQRDQVTQYPWTAESTDDADYATASVGQLKNVFAFDVRLELGSSYWESLVYDMLRNALIWSPTRLANGGNIARTPDYGAAQPGGGGAGPGLDNSHDSANQKPGIVTLWVAPRTHLDDDEELVTEDTVAHLQWAMGDTKARSVTIERRDGAGKWTPIGNASPDSSSFDDETGLLANVSYFYRLSGTFETGHELGSNTASFGVRLFTAVSSRSVNDEHWNPGLKEFDGHVSSPPKYYLSYSYQSNDVIETTNETIGGTSHSTSTRNHTYTQHFEPTSRTSTAYGWEDGLDTTSDGMPFHSPVTVALTSEYNCSAQERSKANVIARTHESMHKTASSSDAGNDNAEDADYTVEEEYIPTSGTARWKIWDFDHNLGMFVWSGEGSFTRNGITKTATMGESGNWMDSNGGSASPWPYGLYHDQRLAFEAGFVDEFQEVTAATQTWAFHKTYVYPNGAGEIVENLSSDGSRTLSDEYTPTAFFGDVLSNLSDFGDWSEPNRGVSIGLMYDWLELQDLRAYGEPLQLWLGQRWCTNTNDWLRVARAELKFTTNPSKPARIAFYTLFMPLPTFVTGDGSGNPQPEPNPQVVGCQYLDVDTTGGESRIISVDPTITPDALVPNCSSGNYYLVPGVQVNASGFMAVDPEGKLDFAYTTQIDSSLRTSGELVLQAPSGGDGGMAGYVTLPNCHIPGSKYTLHFIGGAGFTVRDANGHTLVDGEEITQNQIDWDEGVLYLCVTSDGNVQEGKKFTVVVEASDDSGSKFGTDSVVFTNHTRQQRSYTVPFDEASGSRFRKIGLNGRPLPDEAPNETPESDEAKEESYIDALTLGLHHSTTDVYVPVPGSDLSVATRRDTLSEVWNLHTGLRPHERLDRPFGAGWISNICVNLEQYASPEGIVYFFVTDQNGARHRFTYLASYDASGNYVGGYVPLPSDCRENGDYLTSFDGTTFTDRYGTQIMFDLNVKVNQNLTTDRYKTEGTESHVFYGVSKIVDRFGNSLRYSYEDPTTVRTLIPKTIAVENSPNQVLSIEQDDTGHITRIWDPNGNAFTYGYEEKTYSVEGESFQVMTLTSVTGPDGQTTRYEYDLKTEADRSPVEVTRGQPSPKLHLDVAAIVDPVGNRFSFVYEFDQTRWDYNSKAGYFQETGGPRCVKEVTLPGGLGHSLFSNDSKVALESQPDLDGKLHLTSDSKRASTITDAAGNVIKYTFGTGAGESVVFDVGGFYPGTPVAAIPKVVFYKSMDIDYGVGSEHFSFDPDASLALKSVKDFSGNTTSYAYGDVFGPGSSSLYTTVFPHPGFRTKYSDPTSQVDALGHSKTYSYGVYRIMDSVTDENGRVKTYQLDGKGRRLNEVVHSDGASSPVVQRTEFSYDSAAFPGVVTKITVKRLNGPGWTVDLVTERLLDANGRVWKEIIDPAGVALTTTSTYDRNGNKLSSKDPNGNTTTFEYDKRNRLTKVVYADGSAKRISYFPNGVKHDETDENGNTRCFTYDGLSRLLTEERGVTQGGTSAQIVTRFEYQNAVDPKTAAIDAMGNRTTFQYDFLSRLTSVTDALQQSTLYDYSGGNAGSHAFDTSSFHPTSTLDARGYHGLVTYDALYRPIVLQQQYQLNPSTFARTETQYDNVGNAIVSRDPLNHTTTTEFDALNRPTCTKFADGSQITTTYTPTGLKWTVIDERGFTTETKYDGAGRPVVVLSPPVETSPGVWQQAKTETIYSGVNVAATVNPLGNRWDYVYDSRNRKIAEELPSVTDALTGSSGRPVVSTGYDYVGNVIWTQNARGFTTETKFDELNRPLTVTGPPVLAYGNASALRPVTSKDYDSNGNVLSISDANGHATIFTYDVLNRLKTTTDSANNTTRYQYDAAGNRISVKDGLNHETTLAYDGLNRNTRSTDAAGIQTTFVFDPVNKTERIDAKGQRTTYGYDARGRVTSVTYPGRTGENRSYSYDASGNLLSVQEPGKSGLADVAYTYDALGRVETEASCGATHTYKYDLAGNRVTAQYGLRTGGTGRLISSTYDPLNRLSSLSEGSRTTSYGYDFGGNIETKALPNGDTVVLQYDAQNRLVMETGSSANGLLYKYVTVPDSVGNLRYFSERTAGLPSRTTILEYDGADRLIKEEIHGPGDQVSGLTSFGYDAANNRTSKTVDGITTNYSYNGLNQLVAWTALGGNTGSIGYDLNGNRTALTSAGQTDTYAYDAENRLVSLQKATTGGTGSYLYVYDYRTRRVQRMENGLITQAVFSGGVSVQEYSGGSLSIDYVRGSDWGGGVGGILYSMRQDVPSFAHYNSRGDITTRTDGSGAVTYQASYEAFGTRPIETGTSADRQRANTKEEDPTGLLNEGFRYRDLSTGVFLTRDPAGFIDGPNLYTYVNQNPWTKFDPEGLAGDDPEGVVRKDHHVETVESIRRQNYSREVIDELEQLKVPAGTWRDGYPRHGWSASHDIYNQRSIEIAEQFATVSRKSGLDPSGLSGKAAREYAQELVKQINADPFCGEFNRLVQNKATTSELREMMGTFEKAIATHPVLTRSVLGEGEYVGSKVLANVGKRIPGVHWLAVAGMAGVTYNDARGAGMGQIGATVYTSVDALSPVGAVVPPSAITGVRAVYNMYNGNEFITIKVRNDGGFDSASGQTTGAPWITPSDLKARLNPQ